MAAQLYSPSWYRVERLKPRLKGHARIHRHLYRGQVWYVLQDLASERFHRFSAAAHQVIGLMDGNRTVQEIWDLASQRLGDDAPTQDQMIRLLSQLHAADALQANVLPDDSEFLTRYGRQRRRKWLAILLNPLSWKFSLFDPERLLTALFPLVRPLLGYVGWMLWLAVVGTALALAVVHGKELTEDVIDRVLEPGNLLVLWLVVPVLKLLHEFGHAFAVKAFGGTVHEMGIIFLVVSPLPYVDASAASALRSKWQRILVSAAGMVVELFFASLALFFWLTAEPGPMRSVAFDVIFVAGVSTVLFNANPLLRYDGYYILSDLLEIPNLRARANKYCAYLCERYLFGLREGHDPLPSPSERAWFLLYAVTSAVYRFFLFAAIILFIADQFFFVGVVLALWAAVAWGLVPLGKCLAYVFKSPRLTRVRFRAVAVSAAFAAVCLLFTFCVPFPLRTRAEGVIWIPEQSILRAGTDGFIEEVAAPLGSRVKAGEVLIRCQDPPKVTQVKVLESRLRELKAKYDEKWREDLVEAQLIEKEMEQTAESLRRAREKTEELLIRSPCEGTFALADPGDLPGRFVRQGTPLGYVLDLGQLTTRVVVSQAEIDLVRGRLKEVEVRLSEDVASSVSGTLWREVPAALEDLPSTALGNQGGGAIPTDPMDQRGVRSIQNYFQLDLKISSSSGLVNVGGRVYVRFDHGWEPLAGRWYRELRRLFLGRFHV